MAKMYIIVLLLIMSVEGFGICEDSGSSYEHFPLFKSLENSHEVRLTADTNNQYYPEIYGDIVVWSEETNGITDIFAYNLQAKEKFPVSTALNDQKFPKIYGDTVVWQDARNGNSDIYGYNLKTKEEFPITTELHDQYSPAVYEDIVVWVDWRSGIHIYGLNLKTNEEFMIQTRSNPWFPEIYGDYVVWRDGSSNAELWGFNLKTKRKFQIATSNSQAMTHAIYEDIVVWTEKSFSGSGICARNLETGEQFWITRGSDLGFPSIHGDIVVWADYSRSGNHDIYGYNMKTEEEFRVTYDPCNQGHPAVYGDYVVWVNTENDDNRTFYYIYGCNLSALPSTLSALPSTPAPASSQLTSHEILYICVAAILLTGGFILVLEMKRSPR
ncbi:MAG: hypothetical protein HXS54_03290 [Theionarchaea archaeon]|nr:hypothetical protein [Theionarchaea archaeon]